MREFAYTGKLFSAQEAKEAGFVSKIFKDKKELEGKREILNLQLINDFDIFLGAVIEMAKTIAEKSPVVVWGVKKVLNKNRKSIVKVI